MSWDPGTITIDPGAHDIGVALWRGTELINATLIRDEGRPVGELAHAVGIWANSAAAWAGVSIETVVVERPQVYHQNKLVGDPNDLITIALAAGHCAQAILRHAPRAAVHYLRPAQWKGQLPKAVSVQRTKETITDDERERVALPAPSLRHNVWDAVGIGLYWHKRKREP